MTTPAKQLTTKGTNELLLKKRNNANNKVYKIEDEAEENSFRFIPQLPFNKLSAMVK